MGRIFLFRPLIFFFPFLFLSFFRFPFFVFFFFFFGSDWIGLIEWIGWMAVPQKSECLGRHSRVIQRGAPKAEVISLSKGLPVSVPPTLWFPQ